MFFQSSLGIQVERGHVALAFAKNSFRGTRLAASQVRTIDADMVPRERVKVVGERVREFLKHYNISPANVILGLPRESVILRNVSLPWAVKENLRATLNYEMEKYCPFSADEVYFDYQIVEEEKKENKLGILLGIAKKEEVNHYLGLKELLGRGLTGIGINSMAIVNGLFHFHPHLMNRSFMLIYLTKDSYEIDGVKTGLLGYSRAFNRSTDSPEGVALLAKGLEQSKEVFNQGSDPMEVLLCGPAANARVSEALRARGIPVTDLEPAETNIHSQALLPAFGLAMRGIRPLPNQSDFLPRELQRRPSHLPYYLMIGLLILALLGGVAWWGSGVFQKRRVFEKLEAEAGRLRSEAVKSEDLQRKCDLAKISLDELNAQTALKTPVLDILKELTARIPSDAWLTQFMFSNEKVTIAGYATTASELIPRLEASPLFLDVGFLATIRKNKDGNEQFRIGFQTD